jgi:hypothetical protein
VADTVEQRLAFAYQWLTQREEPLPIDVDDFMDEVHGIVHQARQEAAGGQPQATGSDSVAPRSAATAPCTCGHHDLHDAPRPASPNSQQGTATPPALAALSVLYTAEEGSREKDTAYEAVRAALVARADAEGGLPDSVLDLIRGHLSVELAWPASVPPTRVTLHHAADLLAEVDRLRGALAAARSGEGDR